MTGGSDSLLERLRSAGIDPDDSEELRLNKSLLMFATGLASVASMLWLVLYWSLGPRFSSNLPFAFQILLATNLGIYLRWGNFAFFRTSQLALFLFFPFVVQWSIGNFITASGIAIWGLLAPVGAMLFIGAREALGWFIAYLFLLAMSATFDYLLIGMEPAGKISVPLTTAVIFFALNFAAVATLLFLLLRFATIEKQKARSHLDEAHRLLQVEQERSERLLLNILPGQIAERLKNSNKTIADGFADVTVMFADIVNFTRIAEGMAPTEVFAMLNRIFSSFDELAEQFGLEKIKTIGDAYMVAGGLNEGNTDYSAAVADMALAMRKILQEDFSINTSHLEVRIGIGTGPVVAGVVGKKKFIYDLWGDTVNIASRITAEGVPGMIQVDVVTHRRLKDQFAFHEPQVIYLKGKGETEVHRLIGRKTADVTALA